MMQMATLFILMTIFCYAWSSDISTEHARNKVGCKHKLERRFHQNPDIRHIALRNALKSYETFHAEGERRQSIQDAFGRTRPQDIKNKYLFIELKTSGLGNRMMNIISGLLVALLTKRILIIRSTTFAMEHVFCEPFANSSVFAASNTVQDWDRFTNRNNSAVFLIGNAASTFIKDLRTRDVQQMYYNDKPIWLLRTEQYFLPILFTNPFYVGRLNEWFPNRDVATGLMRYFFHPTNDIWDDILDTYSSSSSSSRSQHQVIDVGIQLREWTMKKDQDHETIRCLERVYEKNNNKTHFFAASLMNIKEYAKLIGHPEWVITQKYSDGVEEHSEGQVRDALHDMWLMSLTNDLVISEISTFGYVSMALKGRPCLVASATQPCYYPVSHEPCFHLAERIGFFPQLTDYNASFVQCEDFKGGWKLAATETPVLPN